MMKLITTTLLVVLLTGCVTVPSPETVMQYCEREVRGIETRGHSTDRLHSNTIYAQCMDGRYAYEAASRTTTSTRTTHGVDGRFSARNGGRSVDLRSAEVQARDGYEAESYIRHEIPSGFAITFRSGLRVNR